MNQEQSINQENLAIDKNVAFSRALDYSKGNGVEKDQKQATDWFKVASELGHRTAKFNLAKRYMRGTGVKKNSEKALKLFDEMWVDDDGAVIANQLAGKAAFLAGLICFKEDKKAAEGRFCHAVNNGIAVARVIDALLKGNEEKLKKASQEVFLKIFPMIDISDETDNITVIPLSWSKQVDSWIKKYDLLSYISSELNESDYFCSKSLLVLIQICLFMMDLCKADDIEFGLLNKNQHNDIVSSYLLFLTEDNEDKKKEMLNSIKNNYPYLMDSNDDESKASDDDNYKPYYEHWFEKFIINLIIMEIKKKELLEKNKELLEKDKELEDMMAMFAHKFSSPLDTIIYNTSHEHLPRLYFQAAQTMRGLLDIFSIISTDADTLQPKLKQDCRGNSNLTLLFSKTLDMLLLHLLSVSASEKIRQHYLRYAKAHELCAAELSHTVWKEKHFELERQLQSEWEQSYAQLLSASATLEQRLDWLEPRFFKLELKGFGRADIQFEEYGITESFLTILLNEVLVNIFKYYASVEAQPVILEWIGRDRFQVLSCRNPSMRSERSKIKGSGKGHVFLSALARKIGSQFSKPKPQDDFVVEFAIADQLLISSEEGEQ